MKRESLFALNVILSLTIAFITSNAMAQENQGQKTFEKVLIRYKEKGWYEIKAYSKEYIKKDELGRYVVGPENIKYYIVEDDYQHRKYHWIRCVEGVKIGALSQKLESIDQIDRVRVLIDKGIYCEYEYFTKNEIHQDDIGYYVQALDGGKFYLDKDKTSTFREVSPNDYVYIGAVPSIHKVAEEIENTRIFFSFNSTEINEEGIQVLNELAKKIKKSKEIKKIKVIGHTCSIGPTSVNNNISYKRAKNAMEFLCTNCGMDSSLFVIEGRGENWPTATNETKIGRARNRRVVFKVE